VVPILSQMHQVHNFPPYCTKIHFNIILQTTPLYPGLSLVFVFGFSNQDTVNIFLALMRATCPAHILVDFITLIKFCELYMLWSSSLCSLFQPPTTSSILDPNIFFSTLFSNTLILCISLSVKDQVPHPYKWTGKIMDLYILIFKFLERSRKDKRVGTDEQQAIPEINLLLIFSWMQFSFVIIVPKYFNFSTFSKDLLNCNFVLRSGDKTQPYTYSFLCLLLDQPPYLPVRELRFLWYVFT